MYNNDTYSALDTKLISADEKKSLKYCDMHNTYPAFDVSDDVHIRFMSLLKMNLAMLYSCNEYITESWITIGVPDGAAEQEIYDWAADVDDYKEFLETYNHIVQDVKNGNYDE